MFIVVGLGNPGKEYESTYHNVGFLAVEKLAQKYDTKITKKECSAEIGTTNISGEKIVFVKPQTFMNLSGDAVKSVLKKYDANIEDVIVFVDDVDIPAGTIRLRSKGSSGSHNGMKDIIAKLNSQSFARVRIGIGPKPEQMDLGDFVLSHFGKQSLVNESIEKAVLAVEELILTKDIQNVYQKYNGNAK